MQRKEAMESDPVPFAVWGQESEKPVSNPSLGRTAYPAVLTLCGPSFLLYSSSAPLLTEDTEGCLLDRTTSQELFGTSKAVGNTLNYQNRILTVRGILEGDAPILLLQALPEDSDMSRVSLSIPSGTAPQIFDRICKPPWTFRPMVFPALLERTSPCRNAACPGSSAAVCFVLPFENNFHRPGIPPSFSGLPPALRAVLVSLALALRILFPASRRLYSHQVVRF